jgi:hypothetical protein
MATIEEKNGHVAANAESRVENENQTVSDWPHLAGCQRYPNRLSRLLDGMCSPFLG